jgi:hypothetical protein
MVLVEFENTAIDSDTLVLRAEPHEGVRERLICLAERPRFAPLGGDFHPGLMAGDRAGFRVNQLPSDPVGSNPILFLQVASQGALERRDSTGAVAVLKQILAHHPITERVGHFDHRHHLGIMGWLLGGRGRLELG